LELGPPKGSALELGPPKGSALELSLSKERPLKLSRIKVSPSEVSLLKISALERSSRKGKTSEISSPKHRVLIRMRLPPLLDRRRFINSIFEALVQLNVIERVFPCWELVNMLVSIH
jgi:hypothetical protein